MSLLNHFLHESAEVRSVPKQGAPVTAAEFGVLSCPHSPWSGDLIEFEAQDWDDNALNGYPDMGEADD